LVVSPRDRAVAALYGLAIGDALGMPTQLMPRSEVRARFGAIAGFEAADADHPLAHGMAAGSVTDDTEQALLLARLLIEGDGHVDPARFAHELVRWEDGMRARGSLDLLGPSTKRAVEAVLAGEPVDQAGRFGTTNGAAMRVTPAGIVASSDDLPALVDLVVEVSMASHNTSVALAGASAIAAAVSRGIDGGDLASAIDSAVDAATEGATRGHWVAAADVASRIRWAVSLATPAEPERGLDAIYRLVGTSLATQESVPAAFGVLATFPDDPWRVVCAAASLGGDSDTIAAMAGAVAGAVHGTSGFPAEAMRTVSTVNHLELESTADALLRLRLR
jgi:ADP-ribosylglycohydrolase